MDCDVLIVGGGLVGGLMSATMASKGLKVIILEAGPEETDRGKLLNRFYEEQEKTPSSPYYDYPQAPRPSMLACNDYYENVGSADFLASYERMLGGAMNHWAGLCPRFLENDFKIHSLYGVGVDWPISYQDLEPWYCKAEKELGVAGDGKNSASFRSQPYPKRPMPQSYSDLTLARLTKGATFLGVPLEITPLPQARDPDVCGGSGSCVQICPTGARYNALTHLYKARSLDVEIRVKSVAIAVEVDTDGKISGVRYKKWDNSEHLIKAKRYVIGAHGIETPKLLLLSRNARLPNGVANSSDLVGRNLMDQRLIVHTATMPVPVYPLRGPQHTSEIETMRDGPFRKEFGAFRIATTNMGGAISSSTPITETERWIEAGYRGKELQEKIRHDVTHQICLMSEVEKLPELQNRVELSEKKDALGIPRPKITFSLSEYENKGYAKLMEAVDVLFKKAGATNIFHSKSYYSACHPTGTAKMGKNPKTSVVDQDLRSHDHANMFIVGSSVFPTQGTANPSLTISALALRACEVIVRDLSQGA